MGIAKAVQFICVLTIAMQLPSYAFACEAEALVKSIASSFEHASRTNSAQAFSAAAGRYGNMHAVALFALGPYRSKLAPQDEARYVALARNFLGRILAENSTQLSGSGITIQTCSAHVVNARFGNGTNVQFKLASSRRVTDISVSGISLAGVLRSKFGDVLRDHNGDVRALMDYLSQ